MDRQTVAEAVKEPLSESDAESEDEDNINAKEHHDFSMAMDDLDEFLLKFSQSQPTDAENTEQSIKLPQIDGSDDQLKTPVKQNKNNLVQQSPHKTPTTPKNRSTSKISPTRSPRTPKSSNAARKYAPLPLVITSKSGKSR